MKNILPIYNDSNIFQVIQKEMKFKTGKLYKVFIDDEDEISCDEILDEREDFPRLSFRK